MNSSNAKNGAFKKIHPAIILIACLLIQIFSNDIYPMRFEGAVLRTIEKIGSTVMTSGAVVLFLGYRPMIRKGTSIVDADKHTTHIVTSGIFAFSRNPIYLGWFVVFSGMAMGNLSWAALVAPILMIVLLNHFVVLEEEKYLEARFGNKYLNYKAQVRRWL